MERCPHCGAATRPGAKFCTSCGTRLEEPAAKPDTSWSDSAGESETLVAVPVAPVDAATQETVNDTSTRDWEDSSSDKDISNRDVAETQEDSTLAVGASSGESSTPDDETGETLEEEDSGWGGKWPAAPTTPSRNDSPADRFEEALNTGDTEADTGLPASSQQAFPERSVWSWGAPAEASTPGETESAEAPSGESGEDISASSWPTPLSADDKLDEVATESATIVPETDAAGFSGGGEVDALSGDESLADEEVEDSKVSEVVAITATDDDISTNDSRSRAASLIGELQKLIWKIGDDTSATRDNPTIISNLKRARGATSDFSDLEHVINAAKERPRDIDALRDLGQQADRLQELLDSHATLTAVIEDAIWQGTSE